MSWKLIIGLSVFGIFMGLATAFLIPPHLEPHFWLGIFAVSGFLIAKHAPGSYFVHGLCVSLLTSIWVAVAHVALADKYLVLHGRLLAMAPPFASPHVLMAGAAVAAGIAGGLLLGVYSWLTSKVVVSAHSEFAGW